MYWDILKCYTPFWINYSHTWIIVIGLATVLMLGLIVLGLSYLDFFTVLHSLILYMIFFVIASLFLPICNWYCYVGCAVGVFIASLNTGIVD